MGAVMIPVGLFVIGPHIAQHVLDNTVVALPNLTQSACPQNYTWLINHAAINMPPIGPVWGVAAALMPYTQEVWTTACKQKDGTYKPAAECSNPVEHMMGSYPSPQMIVSPGDNNHTFDVPMGSNADQLQMITSSWVVPLFLSKEKTRLILKAKDIKVKVMGFSFGGLTMRNEMTCMGNGVLGTSVDIPNRICYPGNSAKKPFSSPEFTAICTAGADESIDTTTTTAKAMTTTTKKVVEVAV